MGAHSMVSADEDDVSDNDDVAQHHDSQQSATIEGIFCCC